MRVGPGDVNLDVIEVHSLWHPAEVEARNVGLEDVQILVIHRDMVEEHAKGGGSTGRHSLIGTFKSFPRERHTR